MCIDSCFVHHYNFSLHLSVCLSVYRSVSISLSLSLSIYLRCGFRTGVQSFGSRSVQPTPKPRALVPQAAAAAATLEGRRTATWGHLQTTSPKTRPAAPPPTARLLSQARPAGTWEAPRAWVPARLLPTVATATVPALRSSRGWSHPAGPPWVHPTRPWPNPPSRLRRFWRPGSRQTVWVDRSLGSCPLSTESLTPPSRQTCSEAQRSESVLLFAGPPKT